MKAQHIANLIQIFAYSGFAFFFAVLLYPDLIRLVQRLKMTKTIRDTSVMGDDAPIFKKYHAHKAGTPSMGGVLIVVSVLFTVLLSRVFSYFGIIDYSLLSRGETYLPLATLVVVGVLGAVDDYFNSIEKGSHKGLSSSVKWWSLVAFALVGAAWFTFKLEWSIITVPLLGQVDIGLWYFPFFMLVVIGTSHAVNVSDGLDGLSGGTLSIAFGTFAAIAYLHGLPILATFCCIIVGALIAFLWYNVPPASIFIGDTGALSLGATLGVVAMLTDSVLLLPLIGIIYVVTIFSSLTQILSKKYLKRKLWPVAPLHHLFQHWGWSETQIVMRYWIIAALSAVIGLLLFIFTFEEALLI